MDQLPMIDPGPVCRGCCCVRQGIAMQIRDLTRDEIERIWTIDRAEEIDGIYSLRNGALVLEPKQITVHGWSSKKAAIYTPQFYACYDRGGLFTGAFDGETLAGVAVVDTVWRGTQADLLQLDFLHVSRPYRGQGLGQRLFAQAQAFARQRGARGLYISAIPSRHTVTFYQSLGCQVLVEPDPELFAREPEDIHFVCPL